MADREEGLDQLKFAEKVGISFVRQYYHCVASEGLQNLEAFYAKDSIFSFNGSIVGVGPEEIKKQYQKRGFQEAVFDLESGTFDFAPSHDGGIIIIVSGSIIPGASTEAKHFTQTFFLAPQGERKNGQASSFFVLNDIVRHSTIDKRDDAQPVVNGATAPEQTAKELPEAKVEVDPPVHSSAENETVEKTKGGSLHAKAAAEADACVAEEEVPEIAEAQVEKSEVQPAVPKVTDAPPPKSFSTSAATASNNGPNRSTRYGKKEKVSRQGNTAPNHGTRSKGEMNAKTSGGRAPRNHNSSGASGSSGDGFEKKSKAAPSSWASIVSSKKDTKSTGQEAAGGGQAQENNVEKKKQNSAQGAPNNNAKLKPNARPNFARTSTSVFVKDLDKGVNEQMLRQLFEPYGKIKSIDLSTAKDKNFAFVIFESSVAVKTVMAEPKIMLNGKQLSVQERTAPGNSGRSYGRTERRTYRARNSRSNENSGTSTAATSNGPKHVRHKKA